MDRDLSTGGQAVGSGCRRAQAMTFLSLVLRNLLRRPLRTTLTTMAMAIAVGTVVAILGIASGFEDSFIKMYRQAGIDLVVLRAGAQERLSSTLDEDVAPRIAKLPGVSWAVPSLMDVVTFEQAELYSVPLRGVPPDSPLVAEVPIVNGRTLRRGDERVAVLGNILAQQLHKQLGDTIRLYDEEDYQVVGIYNAGNVFDDGSLMIPLEDLQRLMGRPGQVTGFSVHLVRPLADGQVQRAIAAIEGLKNPQGQPLGLTALSAQDHVESITQIRLAKSMAWITSAVALLIGATGVLNTMFMSVFERTREIGILRAIGWPARRVARALMWESLLMTLVGAALGTLGALALTRLLSMLPSVRGLIEGRISWPAIAAGLALALGVGLLGVAYPAYRGTRIQPTEALRHE
ncbi:MAG TPA: ABC transporter permease [Pirellulales bacterium]|nr:ABC transporter permease [Pirellulales bacterium]